MIISVLVELSNRNIDKCFNYKVPSNLINKIKIGVRVLVPFSNYKLQGFVLDILDELTNNYELKDIIDVIDKEVILTEELLILGKYLQEKTLSTLISSYQVMLPSGLKANKDKLINIKYETYVKVDFDKLKEYQLTKKQEEIINNILREKEVKYSYLKKINSSIDTLIKNKIVIKYQKETYRINNINNQISKKDLTKEQLDVVNKVYLNKYNTYLLYGVTGSGKTEVYMEIIQRVLDNNKTAIVLIPEISLTPQIVSRFKSRFGNIIAVFHSGLSNGEKYDEYRKISRNEVKIVIGARSAIFAPLKNLGVIIVDEEHTRTYKQDTMPRYDAIEISKWRGEYHNAPVILGSATPTLESFARALKGNYQLLVLKNRVMNRCLPDVSIVDMTNNLKKTKYFSDFLYNNMLEVLKKGQQVILFLNKRGYSSTVTCSNCSKNFLCPNCEITLTYHKTSDMLRCHYCGYAEKLPNTCPNCHNDTLEKEGVGTEKIEEEIKKLFKDYSCIRMDFDTTSKKGSHEKIINDFQNLKYQILIGTQMIAKGLDFKNVTLVGVINADNSLNIPDFRSSEVTFQLLTQVAGRSGRGDIPGKVIIQTYNKDHYAIICAKNNNYESFFNIEMKNRKILKYPPYYYLVLVLVKSKDYNLLSSEITKIKTYLNNKLNMEILGPGLSNPFKLNNIYRMNIIIKYKQIDNLYIILHELLDHYKSNNKIIIDIDFNPNNL